MFTLQLEQCSN